MKNKDANVKKVLAARQFGVIFWDRNGCQSKMHYWNGEWAIVLDGIRQVRINIICITCSAKRSPNHLPPRRRRKIFRFVNVSSPN